MSVYVDRIREYGKEPEGYIGRKRSRARWSHLIADSEDELLAFAVQVLGLKPSWIQYPGTAKAHFDIVPSKRAVAIKAGAVELTNREFVDTRNAALSRGDRHG